jgi:hypothetical protein
MTEAFLIKHWKSIDDVKPELILVYGAEGVLKWLNENGRRSCVAIYRVGACIVDWSDTDEE